MYVPFLRTVQYSTVQYSTVQYKMYSRVYCTHQIPGETTTAASFPHCFSIMSISITPPVPSVQYVHLCPRSFHDAPFFCFFLTRTHSGFPDDDGTRDLRPRAQDFPPKFDLVGALVSKVDRSLLRCSRWLNSSSIVDQPPDYIFILEEWWDHRTPIVASSGTSRYHGRKPFIDADQPIVKNTVDTVLLQTP